MGDPLNPLVLVVEDYQDAREMYAAYLQFSGFRVAEAVNGLEALDKTRELMPDIILMDLALPKLDGWQATEQLKADKRTSHIPIVALTGHALPDHAERALRAGCDAFVTKPCLPDALVAEIQKMLAARPNHTRRASDARPASSEVIVAPWPRRSASRSARPRQGRTPPRPRTRAFDTGEPRAPALLARGRAAAQQARACAHAAIAPARRGGQAGGSRRPQRGKVRLLHHQVRQADPFWRARHGDRAGGRAHGPLQGHRRGCLEHADGASQDPTRDNVLAHQRVNETVMQHHTVIPMSFGTVFKTDHDIKELLRSAYDAFSDVLSKMHGKVEFGLKVLWDRDQIIREIEDDEEDIRRLKGEISSQKGSTYFARMQYGRLIDAALQARSERYVSEIFQTLRDVVRRLAVEQADRRSHDHERGLPRVARQPSRRSTRACATSASTTTSSPSSTPARGRRTTS